MAVVLDAQSEQKRLSYTPDNTTTTTCHSFDEARYTSAGPRPSGGAPMEQTSAMLIGLGFDNYPGAVYWRYKHNARSNACCSQVKVADRPR